MPTSTMKFSRRQLLVAGGVFAVTSLNQDGPFTPRQKAIIYGNILGDGHLQLSPNGKTARLRFSHTAKQQNYVEWQYKQLDWLCEGVQKPKPVFEHQGKHIICRAYTKYAPELQPVHQLTYRPSSRPGRRFEKVLPDNFGQYMTDPETLMVWHLDDGHARPDGGIRMATQGFSIRENDMLRAALWDNFGVSTSKNTFGEYESISIPVRGGAARRFVNLFADTVKKEIPSMAYKVDKYIS